MFIPHNLSPIIFFSIILFIIFTTIILIGIFATKLYQLLVVIFISFIDTVLELNILINENIFPVFFTFYFLLFLLSLTSFFIFNNSNKMQSLIDSKNKLNTELHSKLQFIQTLIDTITSPIFFKNADLKFLGCNVAFEKYMGITKERLFGKTVYDFNPKENADIYTKMDSELLDSGTTQTYESTVVNHEKEKRSVIFYKSVFRDINGEVAGIVGVILDVTDIRYSHQKIENINKELTELNATKDKFFSIISHDLKNPVTSLLGLSELLLLTFEDADMKSNKEKLMMLCETAKNLSYLLENLLEWSRAQTGSMKFNPKTINMFRIAEDNVQIYSNIAKNKNILVKNEIELDSYIYADENMINTVIRNILSNSIKFTRSGGIVKLVSKQKDDSIEISIVDDGIGINDDVLNKIFKIDKDFSSEGTSGEKGTGLGLILCKEFVTKNKGQINIESEPGKGAVVRITFPRKKA